MNPEQQRIAIAEACGTHTDPDGRRFPMTTDGVVVRALGPMNSAELTAKALEQLEASGFSAELTYCATQCTWFVTINGRFTSSRTSKGDGETIFDAINAAFAQLAAK